MPRAHLRYVQDIHPEDVYWCMADIGWITWSVLYRVWAAALAATVVSTRAFPITPTPGASENRRAADVNIFHTSPTAIRMLRKAGRRSRRKYNYHFKHMTTVGEPIEPEVWRWFTRRLESAKR